MMEIRIQTLAQDDASIVNSAQLHQGDRSQEAAALLSAVSHELRTPLTAIKAAVTGLLQPGIAWDEQVRCEILEEVDRATDHLSILVTTVVEVARIEMGLLALEKEWDDISETFSGVLMHAEQVLAGRSVRTIFPPVLPLIYADHVRLGRVFNTLVEYVAHHSSDKRDISVIFDTLDDASAHGMLRVRLIGYGWSMLGNECERIFQTSYGLRSQGDGLGLAICRGIIEAHQGHIQVDSVTDDIYAQLEDPSGGGSCFTCTLPLREVR